jgi:MFS family permease
MATLIARSGMKRADDVFFTALSLVMLGIVLVGFAPSYFLRGAVFAPLPSLLVHLHGAVFSMWIILFVIQSSLISASRIRLHRKLGVLGAAIAGLMVVLGVLAPFGTLRRGAVLPSLFTPASFLVGNVIGIVIFGAFVTVAIWKRNNGKVHKRMLLIANAMLMPPALGRMPFMDAHPYLIGLIPLGMIVALLVFDLFTWRRPLAVTVIGGLIFFIANPIMDAVVHTPLAQRITVWAQHHP